MWVRCEYKLYFIGILLAVLAVGLTGQKRNGFRILDRRNLCHLVLKSKTEQRFSQCLTLYPKTMFVFDDQIL